MVKNKSKASIKTIYVTAYMIMFIFVVKIRLLVFHNRYYSLMCLMIAYCILGFIGIYLFREEIRKGITEWKEHFTNGIIWSIGAYITDMILSSLAYYPSMALYPNYDGMNDISISSAAKMVSVPLFVTAAGILGPITEELIFRFILVDKLRTKLPSIICVILSSVLFMAWHMHALTLPELMINLPKLSTGIVYGVIILYSNNPTIPILLHVFNNTIAMFMMLMNGTI